jgi:transketolase
VEDALAVVSADIVEARRRLLRMHYGSRVGHLGGNLSCLDAMLLTHGELMGEDDLFVLSKGHSAGALYVTLSMIGRIPEAELETFHGDGARLSGHPPASGIPDIRFATGSLGHGLSLAAGLALSARLRGVQRHVFCLTSDGEWQEGSTIEALVFAAHHGLTNLTVLVDHNRLQGFGGTGEIASMDPLDARLAGFDVDIRRCDGHDLDAMRAALAAPAARPVVLILDTVKGRGVPGFEGEMKSHYLPLSEAQYHAALAALEEAPA